MMGSAHEEDRGSRKTKWDFNRNAWFWGFFFKLINLGTVLILISAAAKSHAMKALGPREPLCPSSSPGLLQSVGTSSSAKLFCWGGGVWRTTFFQRLHGLPRNDHQFTDDESNLWVTLVEKSSGRYRASEPDSVWWCRGFRLAGPLAEPLIGYKIESTSVVLRAQDSKPYTRNARFLLRGHVSVPYSKTKRTVALLPTL